MNHLTTLNSQKDGFIQYLPKGSNFQQIVLKNQGIPFLQNKALQQ